MPSQLKAEDFLSLRMQYKNTQETGEIPAMIEHDISDGRMCDHYFVRPTDALLQDEGVLALCTGEKKIENILFLQQPDGAPWQVLIHEPSMLKEIVFEMPCAEFDRLKAANHVILPGEPGFVMP